MRDHEVTVPVTALQSVEAKAPEPIKQLPTPTVHKAPAPTATERVVVLPQPADHGHEQRARLAVLRAYEAAAQSSVRAEVEAGIVSEVSVPVTPSEVRSTAADVLAVEMAAADAVRLALMEAVSPDGALTAVAILTPLEATRLIDHLDEPDQAVRDNDTTDTATLIGTQELLARPPIDELAAAEPGDVLELTTDGSADEPREMATVIPLPVSENGASEHATLSETLEPVTWDKELDKEPLALYEDFSEALHTLIDAVDIETVTDNELPAVLTDSKQLLEALSEPGSVPAVVVVVAERLDALPAAEKETVAPTLQGIVGATEVVTALVIETAELEVIEAATAELEEYITVLFEQLGITYEMEDIEQFMQMLLRPDFQPPQPETLDVIEVDLEHDGTHEARIHWQGAATTLLTADEDEQRGVMPVLGSFVLLRMVGQAA